MSDRNGIDLARALRDFNDHTGKVMQGQPINRETGIPEWAIELRERMYDRQIREGGEAATEANQQEKDDKNSDPVAHDPANVVRSEKHERS